MTTVERGAGRPLRLAVVGLRGVPHVIGGIERHCELLYPALARDAPELETVMLVRRRYVPAARFGFGGIAVVGLPSPRGTGAETLLHSPLALLYARFRLAADILHLHGIGPGFFTPLARLLGLRTVVTHHAADFERPKWGIAGRAFLRIGEYLSALFADRVICVSEALRREFVMRNPSAAARTTTIRHAIQLDETDAAQTARFLATLGLSPGRYLLAVGRLEETKRFDDLIAAHAMAGPGAMPLVIVGAEVGQGGCEAGLRAAASPGVRFVGFRCERELAALYHGAAALFHASQMEGFGLVVLEALTAGVPVRLSDIPVHREFGLPEANFFPVGDIVRIARQMAATAPREQPCAYARAIAARHSMAAAIAAHVAIFRAVGGRTVQWEAPTRIGASANRSNSAQ